MSENHICGVESVCAKGCPIMKVGQVCPWSLVKFASMYVADGGSPERREVVAGVVGA